MSLFPKKIKLTTIKNWMRKSFVVIVLNGGQKLHEHDCLDLKNILKNKGKSYFFLLSGP